MTTNSVDKNNFKSLTRPRLYTVSFGVLIFCFTTIFITGCTIFPPQKISKVNYFDIGFPAVNKSKLIKTPIIIDNFNTTSPYFSRMVFRTTETYQEFDSYNRWSSSPAQILTNYFTLALESDNIEKIDKNSKYFEVDATILCIEADIKKKTATLILKIDITVRKTDNSDNSEYSEIINIEEQLDTISADQFAQKIKMAADKAIERTIRTLAEIESLQE